MLWAPLGFFHFDLADCKDILRDRMHYLNTEIIVSKVFVYYDGGSKASLYCILRDRWNYLGTVLISQNTLKNTGPRTGTIHKQLRYKVQICVGE